MVPGHPPATLGRTSLRVSPCSPLQRTVSGHPPAVCGGESQGIPLLASCNKRAPLVARHSPYRPRLYTFLRKSASLLAVRHVEVTNSAPPRGPHRVVTGARQDPKRTHKSLVGRRRSLPEPARLRTLAYPNASRLRLRRRGPPSPATRRYHAPSQHLTDSRGLPAAPRAPCPSAVITRGSSSGEGTGGRERTK